MKTLSMQYRNATLPLDAQIASDDPLFPFGDFSAFMEQTISTMTMQKRHSYFKLCNDWRRWRFTSARWIGIEHRLSTFAPVNRRCKV